jgi:hypothetical protein
MGRKKIIAKCHWRINRFFLKKIDSKSSQKTGRKRGPENTRKRQKKPAMVFLT